MTQWTKIAIAAALGIGAAFIVSKANVSALKDVANTSINTMAMSHPAAAPAIAVAMGQVPTYSRAFPDRSFLFNSLPSPSVEHLVPFDVTGKFARVAGTYDKCDSALF